MGPERGHRDAFCVDDGLVQAKKLGNESTGDPEGRPSRDEGRYGDSLLIATDKSHVCLMWGTFLPPPRPTTFQLQFLGTVCGQNPNFPREVASVLPDKAVKLAV